MVKPAKGTTTLGFIFKEGVMIVVFSRASMGGYICKCFISSCMDALSSYLGGELYFYRFSRHMLSMILSALQDFEDLL